MKNMINKVKEFFSRIGYGIKNVFQAILDWVKMDGLLHFIVCMALCFILHATGMSMLINALIVFVIGILKEVVWDKLLGKGVFEYKDIVCDFAGTFAYMTIVSLLNI